MSHFSRVIAIIGCVSLAACTAGADTQATTQDDAGAVEKASEPVAITQQELEQNRDGFVAALRAGDGAAAGNYFAPDAILVSARGRVDGVDAIRTAWTDMLKGGAGKSLETETVKFGSGADLAYVVTRFTGGVTTSSGHSLIVYQRQPDGTIKTVAQVSVPDAPAKN